MGKDGDGEGEGVGGGGGGESCASKGCWEGGRGGLGPKGLCTKKGPTRFSQRYVSQEGHFDRGGGGGAKNKPSTGLEGGLTAVLSTPAPRPRRWGLSGVLLPKMQRTYKCCTPPPPSPPMCSTLGMRNPGALRYIPHINGGVRPPNCTVQWSRATHAPAWEGPWRHP